MPRRAQTSSQILQLIVALMLAVVAVGAVVALWAGTQVSGPIRRLVEDVRQIAKGNLAHKTHARGAGEVELLSRSIDRMTHDLQEAQGAQFELSIREREMDLATGVREAILPLATPELKGYDIGAAHISSGQIGGDFHDFIELEDGRVGLLVCDVSGSGVPAALIGSTARSYPRAELHRGEGVGDSMRRVNSWLAEDVRRGMFVTALYALIDPAEGKVTVACAGHKLPLLRIDASDGNLRVIQPDGIALGFDRGPVFDRRLEVVDVAFEPGDRLFMSNSVPVSITRADGQEVGEKAFYQRVMKHSKLETMAFLKALRRDLETFSGEEGIGGDVSFVTITREANA